MPAFPELEMFLGSTLAAELFDLQVEGQITHSSSQNMQK